MSRDCLLTIPADSLLSPVYRVMLSRCHQRNIHISNGIALVVGLLWSGFGFSAEPSANSPGDNGSLRFQFHQAETSVSEVGASIEHVFPFVSDSAQGIAILKCESSCPTCATVRVEPEASVIEPKSAGRLVVKLPNLKREIHVKVHLTTLEGGKEVQYEATLTVRMPKGLSNQEMAAARMAKRGPLDMTESIVAGDWKLTSLEVWMDGENKAVDAKEATEIKDQIPTGRTHLKLQPDKKFIFEIGDHSFSGIWQPKGSSLLLHIKTPGCPTCDKTWVLEGVSADRQHLVVDMPDEDEGSARMIRLSFSQP